MLKATWGVSKERGEWKWESREASESVRKNGDRTEMFIFFLMAKATRGAKRKE
jgi:hypothetical protein